MDVDEIQYVGGRSLYLDRQGQPMTLRQWGAAFSDVEGRIVAQDLVGNVLVLTMWMGVDASLFSGKAPLIFGSILKEGLKFGHQIETATEAEALEAHEILVLKARQGVRP